MRCVTSLTLREEGATSRSAEKVAAMLVCGTEGLVSWTPAGVTCHFASPSSG